MTDLHALNQRPLNQEATTWLNRANVEPDPSLQAMYQLLLWGLAEGGLTWPHREGAAEPYQHFLERLAVSPDQEAAYRYLTEDPRLGPEEPRLQAGDLADLEGPKEAARQLLESFQEALTADESLVPSYPPTPTLV